MDKRDLKKCVYLIYRVLEGDIESEIQRVGRTMLCKEMRGGLIWFPRQGLRGEEIIIGHETGCSSVSWEGVAGNRVAR